MPLQTIERIRIGERVTARGISGNVVEVADNIKVKFDDGTFGFFDANELSVILQDTKLKSANLCPFCKSEAHKVTQERFFGGDNVFQCMKCMERFSIDKDYVITYKSRIHCSHCGMRTAKHAGSGIYKCEKCDNTFKLN